MRLPLKKDFAIESENVETFLTRLDHIKAGASYPEYHLDMKELLEFLEEVRQMYYDKEDLKERAIAFLELVVK